MHKFWGWLGLNLGKHWIRVLVIGTVVTVVLGYGITNLEFSTGQDRYLNKSDQVYKDSVAYQKLFGGQAMLTLVTMDKGHTVNELFTPANVAQWKAIEQKLRDSGKVVNAVTPLTALQFNDALVTRPRRRPDPGRRGQDPARRRRPGEDPEGRRGPQRRRCEDADPHLRDPGRRADDRQPGVRRLPAPRQPGAIRKPLLANFPDDRHAQIITRLPGNESIKDEGKAAVLVENAAQRLDFAHAAIVTTGAPALLKNLNDYLTGGMLTLGAIAIVIMAIILLLLFSVRWRLLALGVVVIGVIWAFGIVGYLGIPLTIVTIGGLPVMLGIGIDYAIQMHARVEEEVVIDRAEHPIQETARNLGPALLVVTFDAIFAFAALHFAKVPMLRQFGLLLAVGVAAICVNSIVATLSILGIREYKSPTKQKDFREGPLGRLVVWLGSIPAKLAIVLAVASIVIFAGGALVEGKLVLQTDPIQWVNQKSQVIKDLNVIDRETGSSSELGVYVQSGQDFSDKTVGFLDGFTRDQLEKYPKTLLTGTSIVEVVSDLSDVPGAAHLAPTGDAGEGGLRRRAEGRPAVDREARTPTPLNLVFRTGPSGLDERAVVVREIRKTTSPPEGVSATPSGLAVVGVGLLDNLEANRILLTYLAILFVFLFLSVRLRSIVRALLLRSSRCSSRSAPRRCSRTRWT